ncbi:hypothetical protein A3D72_04185 [Candidatus Uhrbacteria bacterium RIFCSPHIGHO2_02_FULL_57_19]|uniref:Carbamoyltransferase n=2 Tax=Parcubacteria group TaxID=1794811 RepID=A0A1F6CRE5_9BACT|nr:MAG: hypothetical protein A2704_04605 [Candidatus Kaiserbacteria bacterium RIFCSPHIGHO2_01_FULL_54_36b]OGL72740.1 MAG: hypothetical protein A3D72_04185 [Candidatus Uhrbacteria bacterium RIFCSPHIGHO2_02_FULL_57_19]
MIKAGRSVTNILGISAFYHDSAACLVRDGTIIAAAQEERFTRKKHDPRFPSQAIEWCLRAGNLPVSDIDYVAFYEKPFLKFERLLETYLAFAPRGLASFLSAMPVWLKQKLWIKDIISRKIGFTGPILFPEHHESHAASAFYPSPFREAAFLTIDGVGEWTTTSFGVGEGNIIRMQAELRFPHSLGLLYSAFTYYLGFKVNSAEYKVMGLAPYGKPHFKDVILHELMDLKSDGSFQLNLKYFNYCTGLTMTSNEFHRLFGGPPRTPESEISQRDMDIAASLQAVTDEIVLRMARHVRRVTQKRTLCLAGGVALNCVANAKILREGIFDDIWIQPAAGDAGGALGAALAVWYQHLNNPRHADGELDRMQGAFLGPEFSNDEILSFLEKHRIPYRRIAREELPKEVARLIADQNVCGWFQGKMEFGPRALGARSIVGDARSARMQSLMNLKIKFRESFRPFAPSVLAEQASSYFEIDRPSPYMLLVADVRPTHRIPVNPSDAGISGLDVLCVRRSTIPAVTHVDYSARLQTVHRDTNPLYHALLSEFYSSYGCPVIINTSFNVRGEPIVCTPHDAYSCFMRTKMDYLVIGGFLLSKADQPASDLSQWQKEFDPD